MVVQILINTVNEFRKVFVKILLYWQNYPVTYKTQEGFKNTILKDICMNFEKIVKENSANMEK